MTRPFLSKAGDISQDPGQFGGSRVAQASNRPSPLAVEGFHSLGGVGFEREVHEAETPGLLGACGIVYGLDQVDTLDRPAVGQQLLDFLMTGAHENRSARANSTVIVVNSSGMVRRPPRLGRRVEDVVNAGVKKLRGG